MQRGAEPEERQLCCAGLALPQPAPGEGPTGHTGEGRLSCSSVFILEIIGDKEIFYSVADQHHLDGDSDTPFYFGVDPGLTVH